jgi:hypothetical protein
VAPEISKSEMLAQLKWMGLNDSMTWAVMTRRLPGHTRTRLAAAVA